MPTPDEISYIFDPFLPVALAARGDMENRLRQFDQAAKPIITVCRDFLQFQSPIVTLLRISDLDLVRLPCHCADVNGESAYHVDQVFVRRVKVFGVGGYFKCIRAHSPGFCIDFQLPGFSLLYGYGTHTLAHFLRPLRGAMVD